MKSIEAYRRAREVIARVPFVFCAGIDDKGYPDTARRHNFASRFKYPELSKITEKLSFEYLFPLNVYSNRYLNFKKNPKAELYYHDSQTQEAAILQGLMKEEKDPALRQKFWLREWEIFCPQGPEGEEYVLMRFEGKYLIFYDGIEDTWSGPLAQRKKTSQRRDDRCLSKKQSNTSAR